MTFRLFKNIFDSEILLAQLKANQVEAVHESSVMIAISWCDQYLRFYWKCKAGVYQYHPAICHRPKRDGLVDKVLVTGCLSERYKDDLKTEIPEVDAWFGTRELPRLFKTLKADYKHELVGERLLTTPAHYAYFKISEGCDRPCSFCAIPLVARETYFYPDRAIGKECTAAGSTGHQRSLVIAQDTTYYGLDIYGEQGWRKCCVNWVMLMVLNGCACIMRFQWFSWRVCLRNGCQSKILQLYR